MWSNDSQKVFFIYIQVFEYFVYKNNLYLICVFYIRYT